MTGTTRDTNRSTAHSPDKPSLPQIPHVHVRVFAPAQNHAAHITAADARDRLVVLCASEPDNALTSQNVTEIHIALVDAPHLERLSSAAGNHEVVVRGNGAVQNVVLFVLTVTPLQQWHLRRGLLIQRGGQTIHIALVVCSNDVVTEVTQLHAVDREVGHVLLTAV